MQTETKAEVTIEAVIIRKDGTRENLGVIASTKNVGKIKLGGKKL
jgi:hypothetical protein